QAEDGIRCGHVTGVQTCALPISSDAEVQGQPLRGAPIILNVSADLHVVGHKVRIADAELHTVGKLEAIRSCGVVADWLKEKSGRSEERRVGKENRQAWST